MSIVMQQGLGRGVVTVVAVALLGLLAFAFFPVRHAEGQTKPAAAQSDDDTESSTIVYVVKDKKQRYSVLFRHDTHATAGVACGDCHDKLFKKELGTKFSMNDINAGKSCGVCHNKAPAANVKGAFAPVKNCKKCHTALIAGNG
jgi:c(7)-type cytochrome triheme protein